ncbi:2,3-bisphosphoglycerate-dependent phosphoglycerate mutase 1-like isoform X2 [Diospyros lotus]|uniref:2,3-bisphosphoglycerate-dependent phosphoglycerate mutase 1-like isoform X2 n=1 Tax=Diospyros lotus TaxID=55363 RepID=UPI002254A0BA|nr:2,3-bisphosphoglycerate-dependent phosphoglycerate mutase 1-like isoform X2 [Diospyros lotus]
MTTALLHRPIRANGVSWGFAEDSGTCNVFWKFDVRFFSKRLRVNLGLLRQKALTSSQFKALPNHCLAVDPILSSQAANDPGKISNESTLILIRHGESFWNQQNLFSGCVDVPLTEKGIEEAIEAGKRISNLPIDIIFTSALVRAQMTAMLALTQHHCKKVPIIVHNESEQAKVWSKIHSDNTKKETIPVVKAWQLNERMYGELQGLNKQETAGRYGKEQVHEWRRSYGTCPPNGESLEICSRRAVVYFKEHVISLELSNAIPMLYLFKEGRFMRRGSPLGSTEAGVYAYSSNLAVYREKLEEMSIEASKEED